MFWLMLVSICIQFSSLFVLVLLLRAVVELGKSFMYKKL